MGVDEIVVNVDPDLMDLIPQFLANRREDVLTLGGALGRSDLTEVRRVAHNLKGVGGGYGFQRITDIGEAISAAAKRNDVEAVSDLIEELENYLSRVVAR